MEELAELESGDSFPPSPRLGAVDVETSARGAGVAQCLAGAEGVTNDDNEGVVVGGVALRPNSRSPRSPRALSLMESCVLRSASVHLPGFCSPGLGRKGRISSILTAEKIFTPISLCTHITKASLVSPCGRPPMK